MCAALQYVCLRVSLRFRKTAFILLGPTPASPPSVSTLVLLLPSPPPPPPISSTKTGRTRKHRAEAPVDSPRGALSFSSGTQPRAGPAHLSSEFTWLHGPSARVSLSSPPPLPPQPLSRARAGGCLVPSVPACPSEPLQCSNNMSLFCC